MSCLTILFILNHDLIHHKSDGLALPLTGSGPAQLTHVQYKFIPYCEICGMDRVLKQTNQNQPSETQTPKIQTQNTRSRTHPTHNYSMKYEQEAASLVEKFDLQWEQLKSKNVWNASPTSCSENSAELKKGFIAKTLDAK